jgi:hypothetical protein
MFNEIKQNIDFEIDGFEEIPFTLFDEYRLKKVVTHRPPIYVLDGSFRTIDR